VIITIRVLFLVCPLVVAMGACAPVPQLPGAYNGPPRIGGGIFTAADGTRLKLRHWGQENKETKAVVLALHGFNDHSFFFDGLGNYLARRDIISYAYDQRGFGTSEGFGTWFGVGAYSRDALDFLGLLKSRHPNVPIYLLGASMGAAVAMVALDGTRHLNKLGVVGLILSAPAVWGRQSMPWYQRVALWLGAHTVPWMKVSGKGLGIQPSDNIKMLMALGRDPLIIKETRISSVFGLVNLMDAGLEAASNIKTPTLILYGTKDEIIPKRAMRIILGRITGPRRVAIYKEGYHMLLRDLSAATVWEDIMHWILNIGKALPSGADQCELERLLDD
tara:strand:+ start:5707 stop:6705 length:999 start_codon:yes stop_codon:yes gene_type:complete